MDAQSDSLQFSQDGSKAFEGQNDTFDYRLKAWLDSLSLEGRTAAFSINDGAFLSTLMHFASISSSHGGQRDELSGVDGKTKIDGGVKGTPTTPTSACNWNEKFSISDIEKIFESHFESHSETEALTLPSTLGKKHKMHAPTSMTELERSESTMEVAGGTCKDNISSEEVESSRQLSKASEVVVGGNDEERIRSASVGSDAIRIQGEEEIQSTSGVIDPPALVHEGNKANPTAANPDQESLLNEICLIFPAVVKAAKEYGVPDEVDQVDDNSSPILSLPPSFLKDFDATDFPLEGMSESSSLSWMTLLREHVASNSSPKSEPTASLSLMMLTRMRMAATTAFLAHKNNESTKFDDGDAGGTEEEQSSFEQYSTPQEEEGSSDNEVEEIDPSTLTLPTTLPSNRVPRKPRKTAAVPDVNAEKEPESARTIFHLPEVVKKFAVPSDLEGLRTLGLRDTALQDLPLVPLGAILDFKHSDLEKINVGLKTLLDGSIPRAIEAGYLPSPPAKISPEQVVSVVVAPTQEEKAELLTFQDSQQSFSSNTKKRKKKKKKKKKSSNTDVLQGNVIISPVATKSVNETVASAAEASLSSIPGLSPKLTKQVSVDPPVEAVAQLPAVNSFDTSQATVDDPQPATKVEQESSTKVSRVEGVGTAPVVVPSSESSPTKNDREEESKDSVANKVEDDGDEWETVEAKGKNKNRSKADSRTQSSSSSYNQFNAGGRKVKTQRTSASRKRTATRRLVRDILSSVLDSVDVEVRRKRKSADAKMFEERRKRGSQITRKSVVSATTDVSSKPNASAKPFSMRDVVMGKQSVAVKKTPVAQPRTPSQRTTARSPAPYAGIVRASLNDTQTTPPQIKSKSSQTLSAVADQSTAQTLPETLSGTSANTQSSLATEEVDNAGRAPVALADDSSSVVDGGDEVEQTRGKAAASLEAESSPAPPLPTLLGPGNANSATSSVASSLEAPHASSHRHHHSSGCNENDVGYHLLDVCDRLSRDMNVFMARRALALNARRLERGALLAALQDTVSNIWSGRGNVEMYGSCATQLDLPSSDLDAVILGLDAVLEPPLMSGNSSPSKSRSKKQQRQMSNEMNSSSQSIGASPSTPKKVRSSFNHQGMMMHQYGFQSNGERVMLLAAELDRQPWAVQVKAIPTASVPVVKILADPSKLPGAVSNAGPGGDWMLQQHHMAAQAAATAAGINALPPPADQSVPCTSAPQPQAQSAYPPHTPPPWRGADVMNGLFSIDITFQGPEHGGIGSTTYSADIVQHACNETGLPAEGTPFVQVLMVLKELLAQRRLNEPFSGGLSSYALLLLVNAVMKERTIIREEMARMERHRELVTASDTSIATNSFAKATEVQSNQDASVKATKSAAPAKEDSGPSVVQKAATVENSQQQRGPENTEKSKEQPPRKATKPRLPGGETGKQAPKPAASAPASSWANIARKNNGQATKRSSNTQPQPAKAATPKPQARRQPQKVTSFADAVSRKQQVSQPAKAPQKQARKPRAEKNDGKPEKVAEAKSTASTVQTGTKTSARDGEKAPLPKQPQSTQTTDHNTKQKSPLSSKETNKPCMAQHKANAFVPVDTGLGGAPSLFPQGSNDVLEVLCSGQTTAGKLLMHFLLYYGEHFDSRATAIDVTGSCNPDRPIGMNALSAHLSPYMLRRSGGSIDPITGMLTVDPIVVYDPWEGGQGNNVARSCYAWSSIRWHFAQCYMTLSSAVERSGDPPSSTTTPFVVTETPTRKEEASRAVVDKSNTTNNNNQSTTTCSNGNNAAAAHPQPVDVSPLLELLLSF